MTGVLTALTAANLHQYVHSLASERGPNWWVGAHVDITFWLRNLDVFVCIYGQNVRRLIMPGWPPCKHSGYYIASQRGSWISPLLFGGLPGTLRHKCWLMSYKPIEGESTSIIQPTHTLARVCTYLSLLISPTYVSFVLHNCCNYTNYIENHFTDKLESQVCLGNRYFKCAARNKWNKHPAEDENNFDINVKVCTRCIRVDILHFLLLCRMSLGVQVCIGIQWTSKYRRSRLY